MANRIQKQTAVQSNELILGGNNMGLKQQPKCKDKTCRFCDGKYCTILKQKPDVCRFYKAKEIKQ